MDIHIVYNAPDFLVAVSGDVLRLEYRRPVFLLDSTPVPEPPESI